MTRPIDSGPPAAVIGCERSVRAALDSGGVATEFALCSLSRAAHRPVAPAPAPAPLLCGDHASIGVDRLSFGAVAAGVRNLSGWWVVLLAHVYRRWS